NAASIDPFRVPPDPVEGEANEDEAIDRYGNRVTPAVATYQLDAAGTLYELHSPHSQLPRLGSPTSASRFASITPLPTHPLTQSPDPDMIAASSRGAASMRQITWLLVLCSSAFLIAQQPKTFRTRLAPVPIDVSMQATIAGSGTASAVLTGTKLADTGTFEGLR